MAEPAAAAPSSSSRSFPNIEVNLVFGWNVVQVLGTLTNSVIDFVGGNNCAPATPALSQLIPSNRNHVTRRDLRRDIEVARSHSSNLDDPLVVLAGPGGMGKTTATYDYARRHVDSQVPVALRIRAESKEVLEQDFREVALLLNLRVENKEFKEIAAMVRNALVNNYKAGGIIVFDNVESYADVLSAVRGEKVGPTLQSLWPKGKNWLKFVTTRNATGWPPHSVVPVKSLTFRESQNLLTKVSGRDFSKLSPEILQHFLNELGYCALAICQVASMFAEDVSSGVNVDVAQLIDQYTKTAQSDKVTNLLSTAVHSPDLTSSGETPEYRRAIMTTFVRNLEFLDSQNTCFRRILEDASFMNAESMLEKHLYDLAAARGQPLEPGVPRKEFRSAVGITSMLQFGPPLSMHRIIQLVLRCSVHERSSQDVQTLLRTMLQYFATRLSERDHEAFITYAYLLQQVNARAFIFSHLSESDPEVLNGHLNFMQYYMRIGDTATALDNVERVLRHRNLPHHDPHRQKAEGLLLEALGKFSWKRVDAAWIINLLSNCSATGKATAEQLVCELTMQSMKPLDHQSAWKTDYLCDMEKNGSVSQFIGLAGVVLTGKIRSQQFCDSVRIQLKKLHGNLFNGEQSLTGTIFSMRQNIGDIEASIAKYNGRSTPNQDRASTNIYDGLAKLEPLLPVIKSLLKDIKSRQLKPFLNS